MPFSPLRIIRRACYSISMGLLFLLAGCAGKASYSQLPPDSQQAQYARQHYDAVIRYVKATPTESGQASRVERLRQLYQRLKSCESTVCISQRVDDDNALKDFALKYALHHELAERATQLKQRSRAGLIVTAFSAALADLRPGPGPRKTGVIAGESDF